MNITTLKKEPPKENDLNINLDLSIRQMWEATRTQKEFEKQDLKTNIQQYSKAS